MSSLQPEQRVRQHVSSWFRVIQQDYMRSEMPNRHDEGGRRVQAVRRLCMERLVCDILPAGGQTKYGKQRLLLCRQQWESKLQLREKSGRFGSEQ